jgi:hypothetical protein
MGDGVEFVRGFAFEPVVGERGLDDAALIGAEVSNLFL